MTDTRQIVGGIVLAVVGIGAFLALVLTGHADQVDKLVAFVGPTVAALIIVNQQNAAHRDNRSRLDSQDAQLTKISEQTNGVLDGRIKDGTKAAIQELLNDRLPPPS